jgi:hypothetical protein
MSNTFEALVVSAVAAGIGYGLWRNGMKVRSLSSSTATSKVATAAKGFVELAGFARALNSQPLRDPIARRLCVWYHYDTEERNQRGKGNDWRVVDSATSARPFVLDDGTALCAILSLQATIERPKPELIKESSTRRHKVWRIREGDPLYALGHLQRAKPGEFDGSPLADGKPVVQTAYDRAKRVNEVAGLMLRSWKSNRAELVSRFDSDGNGRVDWHEWEKAQAEARALAEQQIAQAKVVPAPTNTETKVEKQDGPAVEFKLERPDDDRPMLVAACTEKQLTRRARMRSIIGLALFTLGALGLAAVIGHQLQ